MQPTAGSTRCPECLTDGAVPGSVCRVCGMPVPQFCDLCGRPFHLGSLCERVWAVSEEPEFPDCELCAPCRCDDECDCATGPCAMCGHDSSTRAPSP